jgi:hypothetical protein
MGLPTQGAAETVRNAIGIYRHPQTKAEIGCTDPIHADAAVEQGFRLVKQCETAKEVAEAAKAKAAAPAPAAPTAPAPQEANK